MVTEPEGIYISFPFHLDGGELAFDVPGGEMRAGIDQIPGSTNDWNVVQNYARLKNNTAQVLLASKQIPLMQFGGINTGRYQAGALPESTHIYGWPMNNYWTTNFNTEQHGGIEWVYTISSLSGNLQKDASHFGWGKQVPFLSRVLPGGGNGDDTYERSFIKGWPENILMVSSFPSQDGKSSLLHVREISGETTVMQLTNGITKKEMLMETVNVLGEKLENGTTQINPYEAKFYRVYF